MLPAFYQNHLKSQLSTAEFIFLKILIILLQMLAIAESLETVGSILPVLSRKYDDEDYGTDKSDEKIRENCKIVEAIAKKYGSPRGMILTN